VVPLTAVEGNVQSSDPSDETFNTANTLIFPSVDGTPITMRNPGDGNNAMASFNGHDDTLTPVQHTDDQGIERSFWGKKPVSVCTRKRGRLLHAGSCTGDSSGGSGSGASGEIDSSNGDSGSGRNCKYRYYRDPKSGRRVRRRICTGSGR
jgi:hypothetical protein